MKRFYLAAFVLSSLLHATVYFLARGEKSARSTPPSIVISRVEYSAPGEEKLSSREAPRNAKPAIASLAPPSESLSPLDNAPSVEYADTWKVKVKPSALPAISEDSGTGGKNRALVDVPPVAKSAIEPGYPKGALRRGEEGDVTLEIAISEKGEAKDVKIVASSTFRELDEAASSAALASRFTPAMSDGVPVPSRASITISFRLPRRRGR